MRTILTERLRLTPVTMRNAATLWHVLQAPDLRVYQDLPEVDQTQFVRMVSSRPQQFEMGAWGRFEWLIFLEGVHEAVGWVSLRIAERSPSTGEVGYSIVKQYRSRGIATEAVRGLVNESFSHAKLRRIRAYCVPENGASRAVLEHLGFQDDGVLPHGATLRGEPVDVLALLLERARWEAQQRAS